MPKIYIERGLVRVRRLPKPAFQPRAMGGWKSSRSTGLLVATPSAVSVNESAKVGLSVLQLHNLQSMRFSRVGLLQSLGWVESLHSSLLHLSVMSVSGSRLYSCLVYRMKCCVLFEDVFWVMFAGFNCGGSICSTVSWFLDGTLWGWWGCTEPKFDGVTPRLC